MLSNIYKKSLIKTKGPILNIFKTPIYLYALNKLTIIPCNIITTVYKLYYQQN
jgi:hypothetical protein